MIFTGERVIPWQMKLWNQVLAEHIARYAWATNYVAFKWIYDLGCGVGYGSYMLSWLAAGVMGVDNSPEALAFAQEHFQVDGLLFELCDVEIDPLSQAEVYVAFELLEHLNDPTALVDKINGRLLWSVPVGPSRSKFHRHEYTIEQAEAIGGDIWYQRDGQIVPKARAWFEPLTVLGVRQ